MIEEALGTDEIKLGDEVRMSDGDRYGWQKVTGIAPGLMVQINGSPKWIELTAPIYKVRRYA